MTTTLDRDTRSLADYFDAFRERLWFVGCGTAVVVGIMAVVTLFTPRVYRAIAVIDSGTFGTLHGDDVDRVDHEFNDRRYRESLGDLSSSGRVKKVSAQFDGAVVAVRADALDGLTAAEAAKRAAEELVKELNAIPLVRRHRLVVDDPPDAAGLRESIARVNRSIESQLERHARNADELDRDRDRVIDELRRGRARGADGAAIGRLVDELETQTAARTSEEAQARPLQAASVQVKVALSMPLSHDLADVLRRAGDLDPADAEQLRAAAQFADALLAREQRNLPANVRPAAVATWPVVPSKPTWPNVPINVLVAFVFGVVGSTFVALLRDGGDRC